jgi:hypothetical protein
MALGLVTALNRKKYVFLDLTPRNLADGSQWARKHKTVASIFRIRTEE